MPIVFRTRGALDRGEAEALVIRCSAARAQMHTAEFIHDYLRLEKYCLIALPGGVQAWASPNHFPVAGWVLWRWLKFLVALYRPPRIILIGHQGCAWYNAMPTWARRRVPSIEDVLHEDLASAARRVVAAWPQARVELYYMRSEGGEVMFDEVPIPVQKH